MTNPALSLFDKATAQWFTRTFTAPTPVQEQAWPAIAAGAHTLVSAPTGTGKTLSAFLVYIDRLCAMARAGQLQAELQLIYVSPLKSLAADIRENLRRPLGGIEREMSGTPSLPQQVRVAVRTGDTPQKERRAMAKKPPHILITTPESLYLLLTSQSGASILRTARWIILDELHALIDSKRGAHLMLSLARLDRLCPQPLQRIGLSASIAPLRQAADYLSPDPVRIIAPDMQKPFELEINLPEPEGGLHKKDAVWQSIAAAVFAHCSSTRSVIAFVEGRAYAEKLAYLVNQLGGDGFAFTHHGSLAREQRMAVEQALRSGSLRLLCATSSMELGIDVGDIDQVFQIGCPRTIASTLQRLGRAGHNPGRVSIMHFFPRTPAEALFSTLTAAVVRQGGIESCRPPRLCLDVLAQHLVSLACGGEYDLDMVMVILRRAYPFRDVTREDVRSVLRMLAGDFEHDRDRPARPRLLYDRINERVRGDAYSRMLAISTGGTIPDKGLFTVRTENGVQLGELDEEYVFEARVGDRFMLGAFAWRISAIRKDHVIVAPSSAGGARPPFWKGDIRGRRLSTGLAFGAWLRKLAESQQNGSLRQTLLNMGLHRASVEPVAHLICRQIRVTGTLPDDQTLLVEHFRDEHGRRQLMVHSLLGRPVNEPLAILAAELARQLTGQFIHHVDDDDGFLLFPYGDCSLPDGLLNQLSADTARSVLSSVLAATPLFNMAFRYNAARALMMGVRKASRQPLWIQRLRGAEMLDELTGLADHPLIRETRRECLEDYWDLPGVESVLQNIQSGSLHIREIHLSEPSPLSLRLRQQTEAAMMYDYAPTTPNIQQAGETHRAEKQIEPTAEDLAGTADRRRLPADTDSLHALLMIEGDLQAGELAVPVTWLETLAGDGRVCYIEPGLWIAAEHLQTYEQALDIQDRTTRLHLVRRLLRYRGPHTAEQMAARYGWRKDEGLDILSALCGQDSAVLHNGCYYHAALYDRARRETIQSRRKQITTLPAERYAALLAVRTFISAPQDDQLEQALRTLCDRPFSPDFWENTLLPTRLHGYRPEQLDALLATGVLFWRMVPDKGLSFHLYEQIDWQADMTAAGTSLNGNEKAVYNALLQRGSCLMHQLAVLTGSASPYDALLGLAGKGLVHADSFLPVRQWLQADQVRQMPARQRARMRTLAMTTGRWAVTRPLCVQTTEQQLMRAFDQAVILCRETLPQGSWAEALAVLRVWEYTGQVRRGFFIEGLPGIQFIRDSDFPEVIRCLQHPPTRVIWLPAIDPAQPWGKSLAHDPARSFVNVAGTTVALQAGRPVAVLERQGRLLRVFEQAALVKALQVLVQGFTEKRLYPLRNRLTIRDYPPEAVPALIEAGFTRSVQDYVLYRPYGTQP